MRDETRPSELEELSMRVADHGPVDWTMTRTGDSKHDATVDQLHLISRIAEEHRRPPETEEPIVSNAVGSWGSLRLLEKLAEGGYGEVWRAFDPALQRQVALKLVRGGNARATARWLEEARRLARVQHPHVITVYGADHHDDRAGMWMELVEGLTLEDLLERVGPLGSAETARIGLDLCGALAAVHAAGLAHGDIKTRNVMRFGLRGLAKRSGHVVLMDFGSARERDELGISSHTPLYAAPEILEGGRPTPSSDLYALGVLLYRLSTGRHPIEAEDRDQLKLRLREKSAPKLRELRPELPLAFVQLVERALSSTPQQRPASATEMERALAATLGLAPAAAPSRLARWPLLAVLVVGIALGATGLWTKSNWQRLWTEPFRIAPRGALASPELIQSLDGKRTNDAFGAPIRNAGDLDGDGIEDFLIAALQSENGLGTVTVLRGDANGGGSVWCELRGEGGSEAFGNSLSTGDLDGDGWLDIAIGAPRASQVHDNGGRVYVWFGGPSLSAVADLRIEAQAANQYLGFDLDCSGDVDGDGFADLAVGAPLDERAGFPTGRALLYRGGSDFNGEPDLDLTSAASYSQFGVSLRCADVNGDEFADLVVGANWENTDAPLAGRIYIYFGGSQPDATPDLILRGPHENAMLGLAQPVGDVDGDGSTDIAAICDRDGNSGEYVVLLYLGGRALDARPDLEIRGPGGDDAFGTSFGAAGDLNGDGADDLFVGAYSHDGATRNAGAVFIYFGGESLDAIADVELLGKGTWDQFGAAAARMADRDGDGCGGLLIGSRWASDAGRRSGRVDWYEFRR